MKNHFLRKFHLKSGWFMCVCLFLGAQSCTKEEAAVAPTPKVESKIETLTQYLESTGFNRKDIVFDNDLFIIEDDILISREEVEKYAALKSPSVPGGRLDHYRGYLVSNTYVTNIKFYIDSTVPAAWRTAIEGAISQWNAVNGTKLFLSIVTSRTSANIPIGTTYENANWIARAYLPSSNGRPGSSMTINTKYNSLDSGRKLFTIVHEMGHNFGLYHTNQTQGTFIQGTPSSDPNSVMNSVVLPWNGFTSGDVRAVQIMYPQ